MKTINASEAGVNTSTIDETCSVVPSGVGIGAEIRGINVVHLDDTLFALVREAWLAHKVVLLRDQHVSDGEFSAFSRRLGMLDHAPILETGRRFVEGHPELYVVSNIIGPDGVPIGSLGSGEAAWHTDMSYLPMPPKASILHALEIPPTGGDTSFCNMYAAYDALPQHLRTHVEKRTIKHDGTYTSAGDVRLGTMASDDARTSVGTSHPIICTHPETHRKTLYLGRRRNAYINGLPLEESESLLDALWAYATVQVWRHHWRAGDIVLWDNRCTMHRREPFDANTRRLMHRTQVSGATRPAA